MWDFSSQRFANNSRHARSLLKPQTNGTTEPAGVNDDRSRFPGKSNPLQTCLFFKLDHSVERWGGRLKNEPSCQRQRKTVAKMHGKTGKCAEEQDSELTDSFQNYDSRQLLMFLYQGQYLHKEKETSFLTLCNMAKTGLTTTSLFEIWTSTWSYVSTNRYHKAIFFFSWQNGTLSFFFGPVFFSFSFTKDFWFFHEQRFFLEKRASKCAM